MLTYRNIRDSWHPMYRFDYTKEFLYFEVTIGIDDFSKRASRIDKKQVQHRLQDKKTEKFGYQCYTDTKSVPVLPPVMERCIPCHQLKKYEEKKFLASKNLSFRNIYESNEELQSEHIPNQEIS